MSAPERRKHPRVKVYHPISYVCTDGNDCIVQQNMGVVLNISQSAKLQVFRYEVEIPLEEILIHRVIINAFYRVAEN